MSHTITRVAALLWLVTFVPAIGAMADPSVSLRDIQRWVLRGGAAKVIPAADASALKLTSDGSAYQAKMKAFREVDTGTTRMFFTGPEGGPIVIVNESADGSNLDLWRVDLDGNPVATAEITGGPVHAIPNRSKVNQLRDELKYWSDTYRKCGPAASTSCPKAQ